MTWVHRVAVFADFVLLLRYWPGIVSGRAEWRLRDWLLPITKCFVAVFVVGLAALVVSFVALTFPHELIEENGPAKAFHAAMTWPVAGIGRRRTGS